MFPLTSGGYSFTVALADEEATRRLMVDIAAALEPGDLDHAVRRPRRRQDHLRARADPPSRRRRDRRGAEPDLHADAGLRAAALFAGACRSLPAVAGRASSPSSASRTSRAGAVTLLEWPDRAAGFLPRRPARRRADFVAARGPDLPQRARHRLWRLCRARRAHRRHPRASSRAPASRDAERQHMQGDASTRAYERLTLRRRELHSDEFAEAAGRTAGARRQALQRDRASRRET